MPPDPHRPSRLYPALLLLVPLLAGLAWYCPPGQNIGDVCDLRFNLFIIEHGYQWLTGGVADFWDAGIFYPATHNTVAFSDHHIGNLPLYALLRACGLARENALTVWLQLVCGLNFAAAAWVLKRLSGSTLGAAMGAYLFTFGMPMISQVLHIQLWPRYFVPVAVYFWLAALRTGAHRPLALALAAVVGQLYSSMYTGIFLVELLGCFALAHLILPATRPTLRAWLRPAQAARAWIVRLGLVVLALVALLPAALPYLHAFRDLGGRSWPVVASLLPTPLTYLSPPDHTLVWRALTGLGRWQNTNGEYRMFVGGTLFLLAALYWRARRLGRGLADETLLWTTLLTVLVAGLLTARLSKSLSLYYLLYLLPGVGSLRAITRIMLVLLLPLALLMALAVRALEAQIATWQRPWLRRLAEPGLLVVLLIDQAVLAYPHHVTGVDAPRLASYAAALRTRPQGFKAFAIVGPSTIVNATDSLWVAQETGFPTTSGYSGNFPKDWQFPATRAEVSAWLDACNRSGKYGAPLRLDDIAILEER